MNTYQLAEDFRGAFEALPGFAAYPQLHGQSEDDFTAPANVFQISEEPLSGDGRAVKFTLSVEVHSPSSTDEGDPLNADEAHAARVSAVRVLLLRDGKADLLAGLNALGRWDLRGWNAAGEDPDRQGMRFFTPVRITGTVIELVW